MRNSELAIDYGKVCEQIGKLYSDLAVLEERKGAMERALRNGAPMAAATTIGGKRKVVKAHGIDKAAIPKLIEYIKELKRGSNHTVTATQVASKFGCTVEAGAARLRTLSKRDGIYKYATGPIRLEL